VRPGADVSARGLTSEKRAAIREADERRTERKARAGGILTKCLSVDWWTPPRLVEAVRRYAPIALDPATAPSNPTGAHAFVALPADGLAVSWLDKGSNGPVGRVIAGPLVYVNPPYGKVLRAWLAKLVAEARTGTHIVTLLPCARFEQGYLHDVLRQAQAVCWVRKRVAFIRAETGDAVGGNAYASMFLLFNGDPAAFADAFDDIGLVQRVDEP
jgi:hypothetical protein